MSTTYCNIESEILEVIEEGTCEICLKIGTMFEAIVYANNQVPGEVLCLCKRCLDQDR